VGAGDAEMEEVNVDLGRWSRGSTWIEMAPGRKNLLRIRQPWSEEATLNRLGFQTRLVKRGQRREYARRDIPTIYLLMILIARRAI
jgi:hypothetical protein